MRSAFLFLLCAIVTATGTARQNGTIAVSFSDTQQIRQILAGMDQVISVNRDSALRLTRQAYERSRILGFAGGRADAALLLGTNEMHQSRYDSALRFYRECIAIYQKAGNDEKLMKAFTMAGINEGMQSNSSGAITWFFRAGKLAEKLRNPMAAADINYKIGLAYSQVKDYDHALAYYNESLSYARKINNGKLQAEVMNNLGILYAQQKNYAEAFKVLQQALRLHEAFSSNRLKAHIFLNLGNIYLETGVYDSAAHYLEQSNIIYRSASFPMGIASTSMALGDLKIRLGQFTRAKAYISQSLDMAGSADDKDLLYQNYLLLHRIYKGTGKYREAAELMDTIMSLSKIVVNEERRVLVEKTSIDNEMKEMAASVRILEADNVNKTWQRNIFIIISVLTLTLIVAGALAIIEIRRKNRLLIRRKKELENTNTVKDKLLSVISHDLRGPLGSIITSMELVESEMLNPEERSMVVRELHLSASATLVTLDNLLQWGSGQFKNDEIRPEAVNVKQLAEQSGRLFTSVAGNKSIKLIREVEEHCIARFDRNQLDFILRNLLANAIKFSHHGQPISLRGRKEGGVIVLEVEDKGLGMTPETLERLFDPNNRVAAQGTSGEKGVGLGMLLIRDFLTRNGGTITVRSQAGAGSLFRLELPAA